MARRRENKRERERARKREGWEGDKQDWNIKKDDK